MSATTTEQSIAKIRNQKFNLNPEVSARIKLLQKEMALLSLKANTQAEVAAIRTEISELRGLLLGGI